MSDLLREIEFSGLRSEIKDSKLVSDIDKKLNAAFSLVENGQSENGLKVVQFIRKVCWDQLNVGEYSKIDPTWRMVSFDESCSKWTVQWKCPIKDPDGEIENSGISILKIRIPNFCYIQVIVVPLPWKIVKNTFYIFSQFFHGSVLAKSRPLPLVDS